MGNATESTLPHGNTSGYEESVRSWSSYLKLDEQ